MEKTVLFEDPSVTGRLWRMLAPQTRRSLHFSQGLGIDSTLSHLLSRRVDSLEQARTFLDPTLKADLPDPVDLPDMDVAVQRIFLALNRQEKIAVWGDYDVDGATSAALVVLFFRALGVPVSFYIPDRFQEGYGLNTRGLASLKQSGIHVLLVVDCGTTDFDACTAARDLGLDVIIIDHHGAQAQVPPCCALINPKRVDVRGNFEQFCSLAAVGLTFFFLIALNRYLRQQELYKNKKEPALIEGLDLVALGTVCDVMPLTGLNRLLVKQGLKILARRQNLGLRALQDVAGLAERPRAYHLGFLLGPRINAGGRVAQAQLGVRLLTTSCAQEAESLAQHLNVLNQQRRDIEADVLQAAQEQALKSEQCGALVVWEQGWHAGVIGIVAGRLKDQFQIPTFVITFEDGQGKGSARSVGGLDIGLLIHRAHHAGLLIGGGGHSAAGGLVIQQDKILDFQKFVQDHCLHFFAKHPAIPALVVEQWITFQSVTLELFNALTALEPFGVGNPQPRFIFADLAIKHVRSVGAAHARVRLIQMDGSQMDAMAFGCRGQPLGDFLFSCPSKVFHCAATLSRDRCTQKPLLVLEDIYCP